MNEDKQTKLFIFFIKDYVISTEPHDPIHSYIAKDSINYGPNHKLAFKNFGPCEVESKAAVVAYKLQIPANRSVHPIFQVSIIETRQR